MMKELKEDLSNYVPSKKSDVALNEILSDAPFLEKLRKMGLSQKDIVENLALISTYHDDSGYCAHCPGLEKCAKVPTPQVSMELISLDGVLSRSFGPCAKYLAKEKLKDAYLYRDFPEEWLDVTPKSLPRTDRVAGVFTAFRDASRDNAHPWVYLVGSLGSGRSYLLASYANGLASTGAKVAFINANKRFDELKGLAIANKILFDRQLKALEECDLLVIDDFGSEFKSPYVRDQIVLPLLSERAKNARLTFFSSDFSIEEIQGLYADSKASLIVAKQLANLLTNEIKAPVTVKKGFETFLSQK